MPWLNHRPRPLATAITRLRKARLPQALRALRPTPMIPPPASQPTEIRPGKSDFDKMSDTLYSSRHDTACRTASPRPRGRSDRRLSSFFEPDAAHGSRLDRAQQRRIAPIRQARRRRAVQRQGFLPLTTFHGLANPLPLARNMTWKSACRGSDDQGENKPAEITARPAQTTRPGSRVDRDGRPWRAAGRGR